MSKFNALIVSEKIQETPDSCSFLFDIPETLTDAYKYIPGQYLTVDVNVNGEDLRRAYSIFTAPYENKFGFTVKRVKDGRVSNFLIDTVNKGTGCLSCNLMENLLSKQIQHIKETITFLQEVQA